MVNFLGTVKSHYSSSEAFSSENNGYYTTLYRDFKKYGASVELRNRQSVTDLRYYEWRHFHFVHHARLRAENILNTGSAYLRPYHYMDSKDINMDSSLASTRFNPNNIPEKNAEGFLAF